MPLSHHGLGHFCIDRVYFFNAEIPELYYFFNASPSLNALPIRSVTL